MKNGSLIRRKIGHLLIYGVLILFVFISIMPIFWMWMAALKPFDPAVNDPFALPHSITFEYIKEAWTTGRMGTYMRNSILVPFRAWQWCCSLRLWPAMLSEN